MFLHTVKKKPGMFEICSSLSQIIEEMFEAHVEYESAIEEAGGLPKHNELVQEAIENDFNIKLDALQSEYIDMSEEFIEKLDALIGEDTAFRIGEKLPS